MLGMDQPVLKGTFTSGIRSTAARAMRLKGAGPKAQEADDDAAPVPVETIEDMREKFFQRRAAHGGIQELRAIPEEVPAGWDPDADWNLRIKSRQWWKERRDPSFLDKLPDATHRLFHAIRVGAVPIVAALLDELGDGAVGGAIDPETGKGWTCLHVAAYRGNLATCRLLLARRAPVDARERDGCTPLHLAAAYGRTEGLTRVGDAWRGKPILTPAQIEDVVAYLESLR